MGRSVILEPCCGVVRFGIDEKGKEMDQILCGVPGDEWAVHVTVKDVDTGEVVSEHDFPTRGE